jgi:molybdopterin-guanine dinucleotide biosynthesis protein A
MEAAGFVLAGGGSTRMGRDKALLAYRGTSLLAHIASIVQQAAGDVTVIGDPGRYRHLAHRIYADQVPSCGPIGGIYTALSIAVRDWNLVVACDMPFLSTQVLASLLAACPGSRAGCIAAIGPAGEPEPLCAVYHRRCHPVLDRAIREQRFRMRDVIRELEVETVRVDASVLANVNTPAEWGELENRLA